MSNVSAPEMRDLYPKQIVPRLGFDFAIAEACNRWYECAGVTAVWHLRATVGTSARSCAVLTVSNRTAGRDDGLW